MNNIHEIFKTRAEQVDGHDPWRYGAELSEKTDRIELDAIRKKFDLTKRDTVLDVGCGTGRHIMTMAKHHPDTNFYGCDVIPKNIDFIKDSTDRERIKNVHVEEGEALELTNLFSGVRFTKVLLIGIIQYIENDIDLLDIIQQISFRLERNGTILVKHPMSFTDSFEFNGQSEFLESNYISYYRNFNDTIDPFLKAGFQLYSMNKLFSQENLGEDLSLIEKCDNTNQMLFEFIRK